MSWCFCRPTERELTERQIKNSLREIMMQKDLENVTSKEVSQRLRCWIWRCSKQIECHWYLVKCHWVTKSLFLRNCIANKMLEFLFCHSFSKCLYLRLGFAVLKYMCVCLVVFHRSEQSWRCTWHATCESSRSTSTMRWSSFWARWTVLRRSLITSSW